MSDKTFAQFNTMTITGRISHQEIVDNKGSEFLAITLLSNLVDDAEAVTITFNTNNPGLMGLSRKDWLNNGRLVTVTGHVASMTELYLNQKTGKRAVRQRPLIHLVNAQVFDGGLGPAKKPVEGSTQGLEIDDAGEVMAAVS
jgi:adenine-specific DNA methylase